MVDFARFYSLDPNQARSLLEGFLETKASATERMLAEARRPRFAVLGDDV